MFELVIDVDFEGPIFDGRAELAVRRMMEEIEEVVADEGWEIVQDRLASVLRNPTGFYQSNVRISNQHGGKLIHDNKVVYGRRLEGVSSYNLITRFKGYHTFEISYWHLKQRWPIVAQPVIIRYVRKMQ